MGMHSFTPTTSIIIYNIIDLSLFLTINFLEELEILIQCLSPVPIKYQALKLSLLNRRFSAGNLSEGKYHAMTMEMSNQA